MQAIGSGTEVHLTRQRAERKRGSGQTGSDLAGAGIGWLGAHLLLPTLARVAGLGGTLSLVVRDFRPRHAGQETARGETIGHVLSTSDESETGARSRPIRRRARWLDGADGARAIGRARKSGEGGAGFPRAGACALETVITAGGYVPMLGR